MERDFLELIHRAEAEAADKINAAKVKASEIEKSGISEAEELRSGSREEWMKKKERELSEAQYNIKKKFDNKKTFLTVALNEMKLKASGNIDRAAGLIVERILNS
ncbi:MAG: hypothetical protein J5950_06210 [Clostridia bacterium]|nr:hypothetical protein [Clostridia bacterium]